MPTGDLVFISIVVAALAVFAITLAYAERQTRGLP